MATATASDARSLPWKRGATSLQETAHIQSGVLMLVAQRSHQPIESPSPPSVEETEKERRKRNKLAGRTPSGRCSGRRSSFALEQLVGLEYHFAECRYVKGNRRSFVARHLNLSEEQVKVWFQNRRAKENRFRRLLLLREGAMRAFGAGPQQVARLPPTPPPSEQPQQPQQPQQHHQARQPHHHHPIVPAPRYHQSQALLQQQLQLQQQRQKQPHRSLVNGSFFGGHQSTCCSASSPYLKPEHSYYS